MNRMRFVFDRNFLTSNTCLEEFLLAYDQLVQGRKKHLIVVMVNEPYPGELPPELENYLKRYTYIEAFNCDKDVDTIRERIRCAMPNMPLKQLKVNFS